MIGSLTVMVSTSRRVFGLTALSVGLMTSVAACSASSGDAAPVVTIAPQSYETKPAPTLVPQSTTAPTANAEGRTDQVQNYTVRSGDYPATVASKFGIKLEELLNFNDWDLVGNIVPDFPSAGAVIKIPPGAKFIDPNAPSTTDEPDETTPSGGTTDDGSTIQPELTTPTGTGDARADRCATGSYTLVTDDYPIGVAEKFDVTLDALNAANAGTQGYSTFYPGLVIVIPAASDC